jgi:hypothetical protein
MTEEFTATILGHRYRIVACEGLADRYGSYGECDPHRTRRKTIRYDTDLSFWETLETLGHESHHAAFPHTEEDAVNRFYVELARIQRRACAGRWAVLTQDEYQHLLERADGRMDSAGDGAAQTTQAGGEDVG